jgi:Spy/CpxP family protein refolding chaperone
MKTNFSPRLLIATSAIAFGLAGSAFAAPPQGDVHSGPGAGMHQKQMMHGMKEMARLHDDLKLDAKQEALWQDATKASKEAMGGMRERMRKQHEEIQSLLNQPGTDLRAVAKRMDDFRAEGQAIHQANRDRWLTVYDALNPEQKEKARVFFQSKSERMGRHGMRGPGRG